MNRELVVTKANKLVEASYRMNIGEQRVIALLVTQVHPKDEDFKPYRFTVSDLGELISDDGGGGRKQQSLYSNVKALTRSLLEKVLQIQEPDGLLQIHWLSSAKYYDGIGEVELKFAPEMKPYLLQLQERFTSYKLGNVVKLRSRYSVRLYELLKQYEPLGKRSFELPELRRIIGLADGELALWADFRRKVLEVAQRELPKKTDLGFSYNARKRAHAVAIVDFEIQHIDRNQPPRKKSAKRDKTKEATQSPHEQAQSCYRKHNSGSTCATQNLASLNSLSEQQRSICILCANHQYELFKTGAA